MAHLQGLWQQRQGFLTAAAKREQRHLAEAEAEVLRHVAKLVPEAEVPDGRHREVFKIDLSSMREKWMLALRKGFRSCSSESFLFLLPSFFFFSFLFLSFLTSLLSLSHFSSHFWSHFPFWSSGFGGIIFCTSWVPLKIGFIRGQKDKQATRGRSHLYYTVFTVRFTSFIPFQTIPVFGSWMLLERAEKQNWCLKRIRQKKELCAVRCLSTNFWVEHTCAEDACK